MKQTLEQAAEQYGRRIDAEHPSNAATDFLAGSAWQKQQGIEWISRRYPPIRKSDDPMMIHFLVTDGGRVELRYFDFHGGYESWSPGFYVTHYAIINLPKIDE